MSARTAIIISTYGGSEWEVLARERALPSAQAQDVEILIGHDPDGNRATVRNALAKQTTGDYLCFLDGDDELAPGYVAEMKKAHFQERTDDPLLLTPKVAYVIKGRPRPARFLPEVPPWKGNWMVVGTLVPRDLFMAVGGWREFAEDDWNEWDDWELWIRCQKAGARPVKVPSAIYIAHQEKTSRQSSASHETRLRWVYEIGRMHYPEQYGQ